MTANGDESGFVRNYAGTLLGSSAGVEKEGGGEEGEQPGDGIGEGGDALGWRSCAPGVGEENEPDEAEGKEEETVCRGHGVRGLSGFVPLSP